MERQMMWSAMLSLGGNMWNEEGNTRDRENCPDAVASSKLRFSEPVWNRCLERLAGIGVNTIILDLGEGLRYESHPELAVEGSWTREKMEAELAKMRGMGFEVVPKLNFSACHDIWLKDYSRMLSTKVYYQVCGDLIREVCEVFRPKYFHLGMDEETAAHQRAYDYAVMRQYDLWWHDFLFFVDCVEKENARAWIWSDYIWDHRDVFLSKMPKSVIQSNWYYSGKFTEPDMHPALKNMLECFEVLDRNGYDQVPTGSNWDCRENMEGLVRYCAERLSPEHLLGFMQTPWVLTLDEDEGRISEAFDALEESKKWYEGNKSLA